MVTRQQYSDKLDAGPLTIANAVIGTALDVSYQEIEREIHFEGCVFLGRVNLRDSDITRPLRFIGCHFKDSVDFASSRIHELVLQPDPSSMKATLVEARFSINRCVFHRDLRIAQTRFLGEVTGDDAVVHGQLDAANCQFTHKESPVSLRRITAHGLVFFRKCEFFGNASFTSSRFHQEVSFTKSTFLHRETLINLKSITGSTHVYFRGVEFYGVIDLANSKVEGQLDCQGARFLGPEDGEGFGAHFAGLEVGRDAYFDKSKFACSANFTGLRVGRALDFTKMTFQGRNAPGARLTRTQVEGAGLFRQAFFEGNLYLDNCRFGHYLDLAGVQFGPWADFSSTSVGSTLWLFKSKSGERPDPPTALPERADRRNFSFVKTDLMRDEKYWRQWLSLPREQGIFDASPYRIVETAFRVSGKQFQADKVYFEMREAERRLLYEERRWSKWWVATVLAKMVGHGVYGHRLFYWSFALLSGMWLFFWYKSENLWRSLAYSLDLFLPVKLGQLEGNFIADSPSVSTVKFLAILSGWLIVPLAVAQVSGLVKKNT